MKPKTLVLMLIVLVALGGVVFLKQANDKPASILEQVQLQPLVPEDLQAGDIERLEIYAGGVPDDRLILAKGDTGDQWHVTNHFDAPVTDDKISKYLDSIVGLEGEFRAAAAGESELDDYDLGEEAGFHITGHKKDSDATLFHVVVGKSPKYGNSFMRSADDEKNSVYVVDSNLRQDAGVNGEERSDPPKPGSWLDKGIVKVEKAKVKKLALKFPDKEVVLEHQEKPMEDVPEETPEEGEAPVPTPVEYQWVATSGGVGEEPKESGIMSVLNKLINLTGTDIVDPSKKEEWHLAEPGYSLTITLEGEEQPIVIEGGRAPEDADGYLRLATGEQDIVYKINKYGFEQLFPKGSALFTLPSLSLDNADVARIEYTLDGDTIKLAKNEEEWVVEEPKADLPVVASKPSGIAGALARWRAEDYADGEDDRPAPAQPRTLNFTMKDGTSHSIALGNQSKHFDGFYVRFDDQDRLLATPKTEVTKLFVPAKDLYDRSIFDEDDTEIATIEVTRHDESDGYVLQQEEGSWKVAVGEESFDADVVVVDSMTQALALLEAEGIDFGADPSAGTPWATIAFTMNDGTRHELNIGAAIDEQHPAKLSENDTVFMLTKSDVDTIVPELNSVRVIPPEPEAAEESAESDEAASEETSEAEPVEEEE